MASKVSIYSSLPRTVFRGIKDDSAVNISMPVATKPINLPLFVGQAPWGEEDRARFVNAAGLNLLYGNEVTDPNSEYFSHQSQFIRTNFTAGGSAFFLRLVPEDAKQASMRFSIEVIEDIIPEYQRNEDGSIRRDTLGNRLEVEGSDGVEGYRLRLIKTEVPVIEGQDNFAIGGVSEGSMFSETDGSTSQVYPFYDSKARFRGSKGNNLGVRIYAPNLGSSEPADEDLNSRVGSYLFRLQQVSRKDDNSTSTINQTLTGDNSILFSFKRAAKDTNTNLIYDLRKTLIPSYEGQTSEEFKGWGHTEKFHIYDKNLNTILNKLAQAESDLTGETIEPHQINFLTGMDINGNPYHSFIIEGQESDSDNVVSFGPNTTHYFVGGSDGEVSNEKFNELVDNMLENINSSPVPLYDIAAYPFNSMWDSGFPLDTKLKFVNFHNLRPDVAVFACTQNVLDPINTVAEDSAILVRLKSEYRMQQESEEFGTKAARFFIQKNAGYLINSDYDGLVPFLESTLNFVANYMGAGDGTMNPAKSFGRGSQNRIDRYRNHNAQSLPEDVRNNDWNNGCTYAESFDIDEVFVPAFQSLYEDKTSVLQSLINMMIAVNLQRIGHETWRNWTGDSQLTDEEFLEEVETELYVRTTDIYDDRCDVTPLVYRTKLDEDQGFAWHIDFDVQMENQRTVQHLAVIVRRRRGE